MPSETSTSYLSIRSVTKQFGDFTALDDISLEIEEGEFVCFLGPSGCGKTTLLRAIAGLDIQTYGQILQQGRDISALPPAERDFGIVFQSYALFPNLTVAKNIAFGLENQGYSRQEVDARVGELLTMVGLESQRDKYPAQLSGGQQQRIALVRALAISPGLLLLDEPLSALDAKVRAHLRHELRRLQQDLGVTTIMVTHDQEEALSMADRIVVMNQGVVEQVGTPEAIYSHPETAFVADFIGTMNFLEGRIMADHKVRVAGQTFECGLLSEVREGDAVRLAIRPEDVRTADTVGQKNTLQVEVALTEFLGSFVRTNLQPDATELKSFQADLPVNRVRELGLHEGKKLRVALPEECLHVYPCEA